jgi:hypothetical protein
MHVSHGKTLVAYTTINGTLLVKCMGIPISDSKLFATDLMYVELKVEKRLPTWQGLLLSSGRKSILIESSFSSLPNYTMGIYLLPNEVHHKMDSGRAIFFYDSGYKKKYHMMKWEESTMPRIVEA